MPLLRVGFQKTSLIDFPGIIASVIFTHGCNMACGYCHNPALVRGPLPEDFVNIEEVFQILDKRKNLLKGVVITGGEPLLHDDLPELIREIKKMGFLVKLDTNGSLPEKLACTNPDYVAMDFKLPLSKYYFYQLKNPEKIKETIHYLKTSQIKHEFRLVWVPTINQLDDISIMAQELGEGAPLFITGFRPGTNLDPTMRTMSAPNQNLLLQVVQEFTKYGIKAQLRT